MKASPPTRSRRRVRLPARWPAILLWVGFVGFGAWSAPWAAQLPGQPVLKIRLATDQTRAHLSCSGEVRVWRRGSGRPGTVFAPGAVFRLEVRSLEGERSARAAAPDGPRFGIRLEVAGTAAPAGRGGLFSEPLIFEPLSPDHPLTVEGKPYRGEILARADSASGRLGIVNAVRIEEYLRGVVPLEMGSSEDLPLSALEAQAIAARSYALYYLGRRAQTHGCDLLAGPEDQVYGGIAAESPLACRAVAETWGIVALYGDRPIRANYCSTCGGRTDWNDRVWERQERVPYLRPIQDEMDGEALCTASPYYRWEECWTCEELARVVLEHLREEVPAARGQTVGRLRDIRVTGRSPSGRAEILAVVTEGGSYDVRGDRIRWVIRRADGALLRSTYFDDFERIDDNPCTIRLKGAGYGHGVGMCQFGAIELGRRGVGPGEILRHYYPGSGLARWW